MSRPTEPARVVDVDVGGGDVEVTGDQHRWASAFLTADRVRKIAAQSFEPGQLVCVLIIVECAAVRDVDGVHSDASTSGRYESSLVKGRRRCAKESAADRIEADPAGDRDPVAMVESMVGTHEASIGEGRVGKRDVRAAGLLEQEDIGVVAIEDVHQVIEARPDRVDVPAHDSHRRGRYRSGQVRSGRQTVVPLCEDS